MSNIDQAGNIPNGAAASLQSSANANYDSIKASKVRYLSPPYCCDVLPWRHLELHQNITANSI
jgi:hypothetical protein